MNPGEIVYSGGLWLAVPVALAAGLLSFLSPCVLPLVPGYLGYVSGAAGPSGAPASRRRTVLGAGLFVVGFSAVIIPAVVLGGALSVFLLSYEDVVLRVAGVVVILMGIVFIGQVSFLQRSIKPRWQPRTGLVGAPLLGVIFAIGWSPCLGPTLVAAQSLAFDAGDPGRALLIGIAYCVGLGVPFLLVAIGFGWVGGSVRWVRRHIRVVNIVGGLLLIVIGLLMVTGVWQQLVSSLGSVIDGFQIAL